MMASFFWDITPCSLLKVNRRFGGKCHLHLQGRRISQERNRHEEGSKHGYGVISQKITEKLPGRQSRKEDNTEMDLYKIVFEAVEWIRLSQDRVQ
jgi:hypothetical protein